MKKAVVLLSGGLDSATILYYAKSKGFTPHCLIFEYGQRHHKEINQAKRIAEGAHCRYQLMKIALPWQGSSLLDKKMHLPQQKEINPKKIPSTYVPARNIIFLSFAVSFAEAIGSRAVFIGANAIYYSGYPDCRPEFFTSYQKMLAKGSKTGVEGKAIKIYTPLVHKTKAQIIKMGLKLKVPYHLTWSCYQGGRKPCGKCDSCLLRQKGFDAIKVEDPS
jgi:7-cyano-7-deazaguanine synthase